MSEAEARHDYNETDIWKYPPFPPDARISPYYIFISCPGDVAKAYLNQIKGEIRTLFNAANKKHRTIEILHWESDLSSGIDSGGAQKKIDNSLIQKAHAVIAIFWTKLGTETPVDGTIYRSGTTAEICTAVEHDKPTKILELDCPVPTSRIDPKQLQKKNVYLRDVKKQTNMAVNTLSTENFREKMLMEFSDACDEIDKGAKYKYTLYDKMNIRNVCIAKQNSQKVNQIDKMRS